MIFVGIAWVVVTPYCTGVLVGTAPRVNRVVARNIVAATAIGWLAVIALLAGVFVVGDDAGLVIAVVSAPFVGLTFWLPARRGDDDGPADEPDDEPSPGDAIDWDEFERERAEWARERVPA